MVATRSKLYVPRRSTSCKHAAADAIPLGLADGNYSNCAVFRAGLWDSPQSRQAWVRLPLNACSQIAQQVCNGASLDGTVTGQGSMFG
jgi:hypothetical protein